MRRSCSSRTACAASVRYARRRRKSSHTPAHEAREQAHEAAEAHAHAHHHVVDARPRRSCPYSGTPLRRAHDPAQEHVGEAPRDAPRIARRERRHHVLGRAERVVLVAVLDVGDAGRVVEPGRELDARHEVAREGLVRLAPPSCARSASSAFRSSFTPSQWNSTSWLPCTIVSAWPFATNAASASKTTRWRVADGAQLEPPVVRRVAEAVLALLLARLGIELAVAGEDGHPDEVDEVARDDEAPALARRRRARVVREQARRDRRRPGRDRRPAVARQVVEVVAQVNVREDEQALVESGSSHEYPMDSAMRTAFQQAEGPAELLLGGRFLGGPARGRQGQWILVLRRRRGSSRCRERRCRCSATGIRASGVGSVMSPLRVAQICVAEPMMKWSAESVKSMSGIRAGRPTPEWLSGRTRRSPCPGR